MNDTQRFNRIKDNVIKYFCEPNESPEEYLKKMEEDGRFGDLDYETQNWTVWGPFKHIDRISTLCSIYAAKENPFYKSKRLAEAIQKGIKYFQQGNFHSDNWWMNDIGVPIRCGIIRLLFKEELSYKDDEMVMRLAKGRPDLPRIFNLNSNDRAGAIRPYKSQGSHIIAQGVDTHVYLASIDEEPQKAMEKIYDCLQAVCIELTTVTYSAGRSPSHLLEDEHCIKTDYSYHAHENALLQNSYGMAMLTNLSKLFVFWKGTDLMLEAAAVRELVNLLLDGYALMRFRGTSPMMTIGRDAASADGKSYHNSTHTRVLLDMCDELLARGVEYRREEIADWKIVLENEEDASNFTRTKYFWHSDFLSHNRPKYHFSVHGVSERIKRPESILKKNIKGMFLGDGCYNIMQTGYEYEKTAPFLDWTKIPGTTVTCADVDLNPESEIDTKADPQRIFGGAHGKTSFVGGVSDDVYGFFVMDYEHFGVRAKKAWFCIDEGVVCLGSGISSDNSSGVFTTLNQCNCMGNVTVDGETIEKGKHFPANCKYVISDGMGYIFLKPEEGTYLANETRIGSWSLVDRDSGSADDVCGEIFLLGIDHGKNVSNADYAYMLMPETDEHSAKALADHPMIDIIANSPNCQAVWYEKAGLLQVVYYKKGSVSVKGLTVSVDKPCAMMMYCDGNKYRVWLSNPCHETAEIKVSLSGRYSGEIAFLLQDGFRFTDLGRAFCYDSELGFVPAKGAQGEQ